MKLFKLVIASASISLILTGCATFTPDGGLAGVKDATPQHIKQEIVWPKTDADKK